MANIKYLLPCSCGQEIPVEVVQAGEEVCCTCGKVLEVPTLQRLKLLKRVPITAPAPRKAKWGLRQQLLLSGLVVILLGLLLAGYLQLGRPQLVDVGRVSPWHSWMLWQDLRQGLRYRSPEMTMFHAVLTVHWRWTGVAFAISLIGLGIVIGSFFVPKKQGRKSLPLGPGEK